MSDVAREARPMIDSGTPLILPQPSLRERDNATIFGLAAGAVLLLGAMLLGGSLPAYADVPAFLMVFGGTLAVTSVSFSLKAMLSLPSVVATTLVEAIPSGGDAAQRLVAVADHAKRQGFLALENLLPQLRDDRFLIKALALVVDNVVPAEIERMLRAELHAMLLRHKASADILRRAGEVAPAMGLIGTLVGLVQMLSNLSNPAAIGPAMAVAILATLYGAVLANMVLLPLAAKLDRNNHAEALVANLTIMTAVSIAGHEHPRRLEVGLNSLLPPADRIAFFD